MSIRCSLRGHEWGELEKEEERDIHGQEIAVIRRKVRRCMRCGETEVLTENTEVKAIEVDEKELERTREDVDEDQARDSEEDESINIETDDGAVIIKDDKEMPPRSRGIGLDVDDSDELIDGSVYRCGECSYEQRVHESSLREGDICPECSDGYIEEVNLDGD